MLLLCLGCASTDRVMREVHVGVCGPQMGGYMLTRKIMRTGYFLVDHGDRLLPICTEMFGVSEALRLDTGATF